MEYYKVFTVILLIINAAVCNISVSNETESTDTSTVPGIHLNSTSEATSAPDHSLKDKVKLKVYYETLCPASIRFFVNQLGLTVQRLGPYLDIHLVPYGAAVTYASSEGYTFECQHGTEECFGNKVHACAVDVLNATDGTLFNYCLMKIKHYFDVDYSFDMIRRCDYLPHVTKANIDDIESCVNGTRGSELLKAYGDETEESGIRYVPYLFLDDSSSLQKNARKDLFATICGLLNPRPSGCPRPKKT